MQNYEKLSLSHHGCEKYYLCDLMLISTFFGQILLNVILSDCFLGKYYEMSLSDYLTPYINELLIFS